MRTTSGNLDPALGFVDTATPLEQVMAGYQADVQNLLATSENVALALEDLLVVVSNLLLASVLVSRISD